MISLFLERRGVDDMMSVVSKKFSQARARGSLDIKLKSDTVIYLGEC